MTETRLTKALQPKKGTVFLQINRKLNESRRKQPLKIEL
jgi:hypothetical protein